MEPKFAAICHSHHRPHAKGADARKKSSLVWRRLTPNVRRRQTSVKCCRKQCRNIRFQKSVEQESTFMHSPHKAHEFFSRNTESILMASKNFEKWDSNSKSSLEIHPLLFTICFCNLCCCISSNNTFRVLPLLFSYVPFFSVNASVNYLLFSYKCQFLRHVRTRIARRTQVTDRVNHITY